MLAYLSVAKKGGGARGKGLVLVMVAKSNLEPALPRLLV